MMKRERQQNDSLVNGQAVALRLSTTRGRRWTGETARKRLKAAFLFQNTAFLLLNHCLSCSKTLPFSFQTTAFSFQNTAFLLLNHCLSSSKPLPVFFQIIAFLLPNHFLLQNTALPRGWRRAAGARAPRRTPPPRPRWVTAYSCSPYGEFLWNPRCSCMLTRGGSCTASAAKAIKESDVVKSVAKTDLSAARAGICFLPT